MSSCRTSFRCRGDPQQLTRELFGGRGSIRHLCARIGQEGPERPQFQRAGAQLDFGRPRNDKTSEVFVHRQHLEETGPPTVTGAGALLAAGFAVYQYNYGVNTDYVIQGLIAAGLLFGVLGLLTVFARTDVISPYAQALRIMAKNSMLWVMFLASMSTSVFFSFDSRFNVVFPQEQRQRVSELRRGRWFGDAQ